MLRGIVQRGPVIYPILFAIYPILFLWSSNVQELSVFSTAADLLLPMATSVLLACLLLGFFWAILGDWRSAGLFAAFVLVLFFSYGHILELVAEYLTPEYSKNRYFIVIWLFIIVGGGLLLLRFRFKLGNLTNPLNAMSLVLILFTLPNILAYSPPSATPVSDQELKGISTGNGSFGESGTPPDIWYITAEGYSSARTLKHSLDYDVTPFVDYLERNGFYHASESNSNYGITQHSLASSWNMETLQQMVAEDPGEIGKAAIYLRLSDNKAMRFARQHGYKVVYLSGRFAAGSEELGDTYYGCGARRLGIHVEGFVDALLMTTALQPVLVEFKILEPKLNDLRVCTFFQLAKAKEIPGPKVVGVHLTVPGYPFVVGPEGEVINAVNSPDRYKQAFLDQLTWTNQRLEWLIDILLSDPEYLPVIVIQGDHGETAGTVGLSDDDQIRAKFGIMNVYHLPDGGESLLYPSISPVNTFRVIFNYYLDADFELLEDRIYRSNAGKLDNFPDVTDVVSQEFND